MYVDCKLDESYTPAKVCIRQGSTFNDLQVGAYIRCICCEAPYSPMHLVVQDLWTWELKDAQGWEIIDLAALARKFDAQYVSISRILCDHSSRVA